MTITLAEIRIFPVKSLRGDSHTHATVEPIGLQGDRRWMVIDPHGTAITQREVPRMALVHATASATGLHLATPHLATLHLATLGLPPLAIAEPAPNNPPRRVSLWRQHIAAISAGREADAWLHQALGLRCHLVFLADPAARPVDPAYSIPGDTVSFADGFPLLLTTIESLADLNARLPHPIPMLRFRPNLVVEGAPAWAEDHWRRIHIGDTTFRVAKPCDRCIMTTIDPETAERPDPEEPLRTLKTFRRDGRGRVLFGQNLVPEVCGTVRVGDLVRIET